MYKKNPDHPSLLKIRSSTLCINKYYSHQTADAAEACDDRLELLGLGLAALGEQDHIVQGNLGVANAIHQRQEALDRHGDVAQGSPELYLAGFDAPDKRHLLRGGQQRDLADLLEVDANRIFPFRCGGPEGFPGERGG